MRSNKLTSTFQAIDIFGTPISFTINGKQSFQTVLGGIYSIIVVGICLYILISQSQDSLSRQNPSSLSQTLANPSPKLSNLTFYNNPFAIGLEESNYNLFRNESIFSVKLVQCTKLSSSQIECDPVPISSCNYTDFENQKWKDYFQNVYQLDQQYCPDVKWWSENQLQLEGNWDQKHFKYLEYRFDLCDNSTSKVQCATTQQISQYINGGFLSANLWNSITNLRNPNSPYEEIGKNLFDTISMDYVKNYIIYYSKAQSIQDQGFVQTQQVIDESLQFSYTESSTSNRNSNRILTIQIRYDTKMQISYRSYTKLQSILGQVGGLWGLFLMVAQIICTGYNRFSLYQLILTKIDEPSVQEKNQEKLISSDNDLKNKQEMKLNQDFCVEDKHHVRLETQTGGQQNQLSNLQEVVELSNQDKRVKPQSFHVSYLKYILSSVTGDKEIKKYKAEIKKAENSMEIIEFIKKIRELEALKHILLNQDQLQLFQLIDKQKINSFINQKYENTERLIKDNIPDHQIEQIQQSTENQLKIMLGFVAYKNIIEQPENNQLNQRLLELLDENLLRLFKKRIKSSMQLSSERQQLEINFKDEVFEIQENCKVNGWQMKQLEVKNNLFDLKGMI